MVDHTIDIAAPAERVWSLIVDLERWPEITPTVTAVSRDSSGPLDVGATARLRQPLQRERTWTITRLEAPTTFEWQSQMPGVTITAGHHVTPTDTGCRQRLAIAMSGPASGVASVLMGPLIRRALRQENEGFKAAAEDSAG